MILLSRFFLIYLKMKKGYPKRIPLHIFAKYYTKT